MSAEKLFNDLLGAGLVTMLGTESAHHVPAGAGAGAAT